jgi:phosphoglucomutase
METNQLLLQVKAKAQTWLDGNFDEATKAEIKSMMEKDENQLIESFYKELEFGTGGLRGIMGVGTNRMNKYTVGMATQGLANYLKKCYAPDIQLKVAIAYDCRNNSQFFAETVAQIFSANNFKVFLFESLRPTPELSYAIRELGCHSGVVITASHNPKEYNGFKAYWQDGSQLIEPHDINVVQEAGLVSVNDILFDGKPELIELLGEEFDAKYLNEVKNLSLNPEVVIRQHDLKMVYTPIHGTGVYLVPAALKNLGFTQVIHVPQQDLISGDFPTVHSPNPEEAAALSLAIEKAKETGAELVMATDPDADRVGIAIRDDKNEFILVNGNQTAVLLSYYLLSQWSERGKLTGKEYMVKTVVTTDLINVMADYYQVELFEVLTGFKFIADVIRSLEGEKKYIGGGEESYGYLAGDFVRDKDAISACSLIAEMAAWAKDQGKSLYDILMDIYLQFGLYQEHLISITKKGKSGAEEIQEMMKHFRMSPPDSLAGSDVVTVHDYEEQCSYDQISQLRYKIQLPKSNVLQYITQDGTKVSLRPSGTEPKIKFYFSVRADLNDRKDYPVVHEHLAQKIQRIVKELKIN